VTQHDVEQLIGRLLQVGVLLAAMVVVTGGAMLLSQHGSAIADYHVFRGEPAALSQLGGIMRGVLTLDAGAIVQFGLVILIATPVARVALTLVVFAIQRDRTYVMLTLLVLALLLFGLISGRG
jgi:uncharacterized membrane protein